MTVFGNKHPRRGDRARRRSSHLHPMVAFGAALALWPALSPGPNPAFAASEGHLHHASATSQAGSTSTSLRRWGAPIVVDHFYGTRLDGSKWWAYDAPYSDPPRRVGNVRVANGELQLIGTGDASGGLASSLNQWYGRWEVR